MKYRLRKLTDKECGRLMNVDENCIDKFEETNSATQCYQAFGNSIVIAVLISLFSQMRIAGIKPWNEMTEDEKYELIYKGCFVAKKEDNDKLESES